ncbi:MAG: thioredoxin family protein [Acidimicrobiales bacterium]
MDASPDTFHELVAAGTVLVDVWGPQCRPCLALLPTVEGIAESRADLRVVKLEAPTARRLCMQIRVMGLPTFLLYRDGQEVARLSDPALSAAKLTGWLDSELGEPAGAEPALENAGEVS